MNITEFRNLIAEQLSIDRQVTRHQMSGRNLNALLRTASQQLCIPFNQLDYEIEVQGNNGFMRLIKPRDFTITVYQSEVDRSGDHVQFAKDMVAQQDVFAPIPGKMFLHVYPDGIYLKLVAPKNGGIPVTEQDILVQINRLFGEQPKRRLIRELSHHEFCDYTRVANIDHQPKADVRVNIQVAKDQMQAIMIVTEPSDYGAHLQYIDLMKIISGNGITYGYDKGFLKNFCDEPTYDQAILIAKGKLPINGTDLYIEIFENKQKNNILQEENGRVNLRAINNINTVAAGTVIGMLLEPSSGEPGYTVLGDSIEPIPGEIRPYTIGLNCTLNQETKEIVATTSGEMVFDKDEQLIKVLEIYVVEGDLQSNIDFPGSILIKGDVGNGYNIKAEANITILGHLGKTNIECGGTLIIKSGINAVDAVHEMLVYAKDNIFTRYINNAGVISDKSIIVEDGILSSSVFADEYVICRGKRGIISASFINARLGIYAKNFGSVSGTSTELSVAIPKKIQDERHSLQEKYESYRGKIKSLRQRLNAQNRQKEIISQMGSINVEFIKQIGKNTEELQAQIKQIEQILFAIHTRLQELEAEIKDLSNHAFVSNEKNLNPGVVITIGTHHMDIQSAYAKGLTFHLKNEEIQPCPLEHFDLEQFVENDRNIK